MFDGLSKGKKVLVIVVIISILAIIPLFIKSGYIMGVLSRIVLYTILAGSLNIINGYTNQFSIGHAGFFAVGAYAGAILMLKTGIPFWIAVPLAGIAAGIIGYLVSLPTYRMSGIYLSIVTLGFSEIIRIIALNWTWLTGGPMGLKGIPSPNFFGFKVVRANHYYYIFLLFAILFLFVSYRVLKSRVGRAWMSIREDQQAAQSLGVEITKYKGLNFFYGAFWAGIAGAIYAPYLNFIDSTIFTLDEGFNILSMVIIGGMGTLVGPVAGSVAVNMLNELLRPVSEWRLVAYGVLIIVMMWIRPQGIAGESSSSLTGGTSKQKEKKVKGGAI